VRGAYALAVGDELRELRGREAREEEVFAQHAEHHLRLLGRELHLARLQLRHAIAQVELGLGGGHDGARMFALLPRLLRLR
jgi:hypothetical protein